MAGRKQRILNSEEIYQTNPHKELKVAKGSQTQTDEAGEKRGREAGAKEKRRIAVKFLLWGLWSLRPQHP